MKLPFCRARNEPLSKEETPTTTETGAETGMQEENSEIPVEAAEVFTGIKKVAAGATLSFCLTDSGDVYAFGSNLRNQLGTPLPKTARQEVLPTKLIFPDNSKIVNIAAGYEFGLALGEDGRVWVWGSGHGSFGSDAEDDKGRFQHVPLNTEHRFKLLSSLPLLAPSFLPLLCSGPCLLHSLLSSLAVLHLLPTSLSPPRLSPLPLPAPHLHQGCIVDVLDGKFFGSHRRRIRFLLGHQQTR
jgi:hypothetical protein